MPSLIVFPFVGIFSIGFFGGCLAYMLVCVMTLRVRAIERFGEKYPFFDVSDMEADPEKAR